jgi:hypothetical protein
MPMASTGANEENRCRAVFSIEPPPFRPGEPASARPKRLVRCQATPAHHIVNPGKRIHPPLAVTIPTDCQIATPLDQARVA